MVGKLTEGGFPLVSPHARNQLRASLPTKGHSQWVSEMRFSEKHEVTTWTTQPPSRDTESMESVEAIYRTGKSNYSNLSRRLKVRV